MLELDECDHLLVSNPFADDDGSAESTTSDDHPALITLTRHPLRSRSTSPVRPYDTPSVPLIAVAATEGETRPSSTCPPSSDSQAAAEDNHTCGGGEDEASLDIIIHPVGPSDSLAGVALRYGVSIATLRRANRLWPSDPIHLRTELLVPRGNGRHTRRKPRHTANSDPTVRPAVEPAFGLSPDFVVSSFVSARNMILSVLPGRLSLESLNSKTSTSEDHELDDLQTASIHKLPAGIVAPFAQEGYELSVFGAPRTGFSRSRIPKPQIPGSSVNDHHLGLGYRRSLNDLGWQPTPSPPTSAARLRRTQPFAARPVRTSQLEPEPAMELPVRRPRLNDCHFMMGDWQPRDRTPFG